MRFYVAYIQDCGYGAAMTCHGVIEAPDLATARSEWQPRLASQGFAVSPAFSNEPDQLFAVPDRMAEWSNEAILEEMDKP